MSAPPSGAAASGRPPVLGRLDPAAPAPFPATSIVRRVVATPATALLVQRALVMEVAHPAVAAGVEHHSRFRSQPWRRAWVTADAALRLTFGDDDVARGAVRQIYGVHDHINGEIPAPVEGAMPLPYTAHDAALLLWVWATLVDTAETAYTRWVRPFDDEEAHAFYRDMRALGLFLGIPDGLLPADRGAFARYLADMVASGSLGTTEGSRRLARQVLWFRHWSVPPALVRLERVLALATMDVGLRTRLGVEPTRADDALGRRVDGLLRSHYRHLPRFPVPQPLLPALYVWARRPSIGWARHLRRPAG